MIGICDPAVITWSIDTTGMSHPGRWVQQAGEAFDRWTFLGHTFTYVPTGGDVAIVVGAMPDTWFAYGMGTDYVWDGEDWQATKGVIVINPTYAWAWSIHPEPLLAHEMGHVLGIDHSDDPSSLMNHAAVGPDILPTDRPNC